MNVTARLMVIPTKVSPPQTNHDSSRYYHIKYACIMAVVDVDFYTSLELYNIYKYSVNDE